MERFNPLIASAIFIEINFPKIYIVDCCDYVPTKRTILVRWRETYMDKNIGQSEKVVIIFTMAKNCMQSMLKSDWEI